MAGFIQNEPVPYMDLQTLWNDRRDPHANPISTSPRRETARGKPSGLASAVESLFDSGGSAEDKASLPLTNKRLYGSEG